MAHQIEEHAVKIGVIVDPQTNDVIEKWSAAEKRSKRSHLSYLVEQLAKLSHTHPEDLQRLGLIGAFRN